MATEKSKRTYWSIIAAITMLLVSGVGCAPSNRTAQVADDHVAHVAEDRGSTPLHRAVAAEDDIENIKFLVSEGIDVNAKNDGGYAALHLAVHSENAGNAEVVKFLVSEGADVNAKNNDGMTPLHIVIISKGSIEFVTILISNGADVNAKNNDGMTPLHYAAFGGNVEIAKFLISNGANVHAKVDDVTPLDLAREKKNTAMIEYLTSIDKE